MKPGSLAVIGEDRRFSVPKYSRVRTTDQRWEARQFIINDWERWYAAEGHIHGTKRKALRQYSRLYNERSLPLPVSIYNRIKKLSVATLQRWKKNLREQAAGALPALSDNLNVDGLLTPFRTELTHPQQQFALAHYFHQGKPGVQAVYELMRMSRFAGGPKFAYMTLYRYLKNIEKYNAGFAALTRGGDKAFKDTIRGYITRDWNLLKPDDLWVADGHKLDVEVRTPDGKKISRPVVVAFMDARSRYITGVSLHWTENTYCVLQALAFGLVFNGTPRKVLFDNGSSFKNHALLGEEFDAVKVSGILERLGIEPIYSIPGEPQSKPVERLFGTLKNRFSRFWKSFTGGAPQWRPEQNGRLELSDYPDIYEVYEYLIRWMQAYNAHHAHGGLRGRTALEVYASADHRRRQPADLKPLMRLAYVRTIRRNGVRIRIRGIDVDYYNPEWTHYFTGNGERYLVYINDYNLRSVDIHERNGRYLFTAYAREQLHPLASRDEEGRAALSRLMAENRRSLKAARQQAEEALSHAVPSYRELLDGVEVRRLEQKTAHNWEIDEDRDGFYLEDEHEEGQAAVNILFNRQKENHHE